MVKKISENEFNEVKESKAALVDFSATWCGPCKMLAPVLEGISEKYADKVNFFNIDVDDNPSIAEEFGIQSIPALAFFKDGQKVSMSIGFKPEAGITAWIDSNL